MGVAVLLRLSFVFIFWVLTGCSIAPSSIVPHPTTAQAPAPVAVAPENGAIFQAGTYRPLFTDYRARAVGDVLTIVVQEKVSAAKNNAVSDSKTGNIQGKLTNLFGLNIKNLEITEAAKITSDGKAVGSSSYNFSGTVAVTVIEVMPNGNLLVSGEKQIGMDKGAEFIRLSGMVVPASIDVGNSIPSTKLADARIEYRTNSQFDAAELLKWVGRFFSAATLL
ncbi:MAG: hypothetical protein RI893_995 [Pseudomonadota bacterium]|jgi:flagellar L-ring protein precursor FlgH